MDKKVFVTREIPQTGLDMLRQKGFEVDVWPKDRIISKKELIKTLRKKSYDAVLCLLTDTIDSEVFDAVPNIKMYANYADGFNNIDVKEAAKRGITVSNTPGVSSLAVAEHAVSLMLSLSTRIVEADDFTRKGKYKGWAPMNFIGTDLSGKTLGLVGSGHIGSKTATIMKNGFGAKIVYYDVTQNKDIEENLGGKRVETIESLIKESDFISLHVPLTEATKHLMNEERIRMMKPTAFLVNTSRGPVVDEKALVKALQNKKIAGAGLDVFEFEPKLTKGLAKLQDVVLTPHIASSRDSVRNAMAKMAAQNIIDFFETGTPKNKVV